MTVSDSTTNPQSGSEAATPADVRAWARETGHVVGSRGRLSESLRETFERETGRSVQR